MNQSLRSELRLKLDGQQPPEIKHQFLAFKVVVYGRFDCLFSFYIYCSKNEEDLERSHDMLQRELRALLEMEGKKKLIVTDKGCVSTRRWKLTGLFNGKSKCLNSVTCPRKTVNFVSRKSLRFQRKLLVIPGTSPPLSYLWCSPKRKTSTCTKQSTFLSNRVLLFYDDTEFAVLPAFKQ